MRKSRDNFAVEMSFLTENTWSRNGERQFVNPVNETSDHRTRQRNRALYERVKKWWCALHTFNIRLMSTGWQAKSSQRINKSDYRRNFERKVLIKL